MVLPSDPKAREQALNQNEIYFDQTHFDRFNRQLFVNEPIDILQKSSSKMSEKKNGGSSMQDKFMTDLMNYCN